MADQGAAAPAAPAASTEAPAAQNTNTTSTQAAPEAAPAPKAVAAAANKVDAEKVAGTQKYKLVIDGQEEELTQEELVSYAQKAKASDKRFQESAQIRKEALELVKMLQTNPEKVLADPAILGGNDKVVEFAKRILAQEMAEAQKPEAVRQKEKAERELQELRDQYKRENEERQQQEYNNMVKQHEAQLEEQIQDAMETSGLPKSAYVLKKLADVMISSLEHEKEITPKQAMNIVKREMQRDLKEHIDLTPEDALEQLMGDKLKSIRKRQVAKIKADQSPPSANQIKASASRDTTAKPAASKVSVRDWLRGK